MKRWFHLALALIPLLALALPTQAGADSRFAHIHFNDNAHVVTLAIPVPPCRPDHKGTACTWTLFVNEPSAVGQPVVGSPSGTSGVLSVSYPSFCGLIQADALVGSPQRKEVGYRHQINTCSCPSPPNQISLTSYVKPAPTTGGTGTGLDELTLGLGLLVVAGAIGRRKATSHPVNR